MKNFRKIIKQLSKRGEKIATMESCTGGGVANAITSIDGASEVLEFSAVTYSNEYKIKMGVNKSIIEKYSVYSMETAEEMAYNIANYANASYGVGITGKLNRIDKSNNYGRDNEVFISIYNNNNFYNRKIEVTKNSRIQNKRLIIDEIIDMMETIIWGEK